MNFAKLYSQIMEPVSNSQPDPAVEAAITAALERRAEPRIPADFAARIVAALPPAQPVRRRMPLGHRVALITGAIALAAMAVLAPHAAPSYTNLPFDAELLLCAELAGIGSWLVLRGREI